MEIKERERHFLFTYFVKYEMNETPSLYSESGQKEKEETSFMLYSEFFFFENSSLDKNSFSFNLR